MESVNIQGVSAEERQTRIHVGIASICSAVAMLAMTTVAVRALSEQPVSQHVFPFPQILAGLSLWLAAQVIAWVRLFRMRKDFAVVWAWPRLRAERPEPLLSIEPTGTGALRPIDTEEARIANSPRRLFIAEGPLFAFGFPSLLAATAILWMRTRPPPPGWVVEGVNLVKETTTSSGMTSRQFVLGSHLDSQLVWKLIYPSSWVVHWGLPLSTVLAALGMGLLLRSRKGPVALNRRVGSETAAFVLAAAAAILLQRHWRYGYWFLDFSSWYIYLVITWWRWTVPGLALVGTAALGAGCGMEHRRLNDPTPPR